MAKERGPMDPWTKHTFVKHVMTEIRHFYQVVNHCGFVNWTALACAVMRGAAYNYPLDLPVTTLAEAKDHLGRVFKKFKTTGGSDADYLDDQVMYFMAQINDSLAALERSNQDVEIGIHFIERHYRGDDRFECCIEVDVGHDKFTYPLGATWDEVLKEFPTIDSLKTELAKLDEFNCEADHIRFTTIEGEQGLYA